MLYSILSSLGTGTIVSVVVLLLFKHYLPSYLGEKGKNLATKEDIAAITDEVAKVNHRYNTIIEDLKARNQLRHAALDKRLQAHQEAFTHWRTLIGNANESGAAVMACQSWWEKNCLYLEPHVREAFFEAYTNAQLRNEFITMHAESRLVTQAWDKILAFPNILFAAVQLPPMSEVESEYIRKKASPDKGVG